MKSAITIIFFLGKKHPFMSYSQYFNNRTVLGKEYARTMIKQAINNKNDKPFYDTLIPDKQTAIGIAEKMLFKIYGKKNIVAQRPYESYLIDGYLR
jgi:hypothetical protein